MLKIEKKVSQYVKNNKERFVYSVVGSENEIAKYKENRIAAALSDGIEITDEVAGLFFSDRLVNPNDELHLTKSGGYTVYRDLEAIAKRRETLEKEQTAKYKALMNITGATADQMLAMIMAQ